MRGKIFWGVLMMLGLLAGPLAADEFGLLPQDEFETLPKGVVNLVNGAAEAADALLEHPLVRAISFVGSTAVARSVYARAAAEGKRAQCQGGAKNPIILLPDADPEMTTRIVADSATAQYFKPLPWYRRAVPYVTTGAKIAAYALPW